MGLRYYVHPYLYNIVTDKIVGVPPEDYYSEAVTSPRPVRLVAAAEVSAQGAIVTAAAVEHPLSAMVSTSGDPPAVVRPTHGRRSSRGFLSPGVPPRQSGRAPTDPAGTILARILMRSLGIVVIFGRVRVPGLRVVDVIHDAVCHCSVGGTRGMDWVRAPQSSRFRRLLVRVLLFPLTNTNHLVWA